MFSVTAQLPSNINMRWEQYLSYPGVLFDPIVRRSVPLTNLSIILVKEERIRNMRLIQHQFAHTRKDELQIGNEYSKGSLEEALRNPNKIESSSH